MRKCIALVMALVLASSTTVKASSYEPCYLSDEIIGYCFDAEYNFGISAALIAAIIQVESSGRTNAVNESNSVRCLGLMQVADYHVQDPEDLFDADFNIRIGTSILAEDLEKADGELSLALAYYNGQSHALEKFNKWADSPEATSGKEYSNEYATKVIKLAEQIEQSWFN